MPKKKGISITEYARLEGISRQAAYDRLKSGKIIQESDGSIDHEKAKRQWTENRDEIQVQRGAHSGKGKKPEPGTSLSDLQRAGMALKIKRPADVAASSIPIRGKAPGTAA